MVRRVSAILAILTFWALVCTSASTQSMSSASARDAKVTDPPKTAESPAAQQTSAAQSAPTTAPPATGSAPEPAVSGAFDSSFESTPDLGLNATDVDPSKNTADSPKVDPSKSVNLNAPGGSDGQAAALALSSSSRSGLSVVPGWAWLALIALGVGVAFAIRAASAEPGRETARMSSWLAPCCPYCQNPIARPSSRRSRLETWVLPIFLIAPVRCLDCRRRYYSFALFARGSNIENP